MPNEESRRSDLLSLSLTELALILVFLLLVILVASTDRMTEKLDEKREELAAALRNPEAFADLRALAQEVRSAATASGKSELAPAEEDYRDLVSGALAEGQDAIQALEPLRKRASDAEEAASTCQVSLDRASETIVQATTQEHELRSNLDDSVKDLQTKELQIKKMLSRGLDLPPCWPIQRGEELVGVDFTYDIVVFPDRFDVLPAWPLRREKEIGDIPGGTSMPGCGLSKALFESAAQPILAWSDGEQCRLYVRIYRGQKSEIYPENRRLVENYFYKGEFLHSEPPTCPNGS